MRGSRKHLGNLLNDVGDDFIGWGGGVLRGVGEGGGVGRWFRLGSFWGRGRVWVGLKSASLLLKTKYSSTHWRGLESLGRDLVVDGIGWDLDITRSALLQDIREHLVESFSPGSIGDWRDSI